PLSLALGAEATFVARTIDSDRKHLQSVLRAAADHQGSAFVEIYQNCNIFNDGAFELIKDASSRDDHLIRLEHGQPVTFGAQQQFSVVHPAGGFGLQVQEGGEAIVHDTTVDDPAYAFALSRLSGSDLGTTPIGVFRDVRRPTYDELLAKQLADARTDGNPDQMLDELLTSADTWTIL
ncbi:2-oxoacid:ferredoxin oxidoreductase subunit beta, partial [Paractinoplanes deccanensis]